MDPLSIAASIAGLTALTASVIRVVENVSSAIKRRPALLLEITSDLKALKGVLSDLQDATSSQPAKDITALGSVIQGCENVIKQIQTDLLALKAALKGGRVARAYAKLTFTSKIESMNTLRDQLDKYKSTLAIAVSVRIL